MYEISTLISYWIVNELLQLYHRFDWSNASTERNMFNSIRWKIAIRWTHTYTAEVLKIKYTFAINERSYFIASVCGWNVHKTTHDRHMWRSLLAISLPFHGMQFHIHRFYLDLWFNCIFVYTKNLVCSFDVRSFTDSVQQFK